MSKKSRQNIVYSTNPDFEYEYFEELEENTPPPEEQHLKILLDKKQRKGKTVTLIEGFKGNSNDLENLAKELKKYCGVGGNAKNRSILIQGEHKEKICQFLTKKGYNTIIR